MLLEEQRGKAQGGTRQALFTTGHGNAVNMSERLEHEPLSVTTGCAKGLSQKAAQRQGVWVAGSTGDAQEPGAGTGSPAEEEGATAGGSGRA